MRSDLPARGLRELHSDNDGRRHVVVADESEQTETDKTEYAIDL